MGVWRIETLTYASSYACIETMAYHSIVPEKYCSIHAGNISGVFKYYFTSMMFNNSHNNDPVIEEVYHKTDVVRKPITGIVSGYHQLPYILVSPDDEDESKTLQITGKINVSPKFIISPHQLGETFGDVFDPTTFDEDIQGRIFSFLYHKKKNFKLESEEFEIQNFDEKPLEHLDRVHDRLMMQENVDTALIFSPRFDYYPVSIDKFVNEVLEREFRL